MNETDKKFLLRAIELSKESAKAGGFPAGAVVVMDGQILGEGLSLGLKHHDATEHGEITAIRVASKKIQNRDLPGATLYGSMEPCLMCFAACYWSSISRIVYALPRTEELAKKFYYEGLSKTEDVNDANNRKIELVAVPELAAESLQVIQEWEAGLSKF
jgi:guanine deaminase